MPDTKQPWWGRCGKCEHHWIAMYVPMPIQNAVRIMRGMHCPQCAAASTDIFLFEPGATPPTEPTAPGA